MLHTKFIQIWYLDGWVKIWAGNKLSKKSNDRRSIYIFEGI